MNLPNSALAYFTKASKPRISKHRIHGGANGVHSSTCGSNDLVRWFVNIQEAKNHYRRLGWRVWRIPGKLYGETYFAFKINH